MKRYTLATIKLRLAAGSNNQMDTPKNTGDHLRRNKTRLDCRLRGNDRNEQIAKASFSTGLLLSALLMLAASATAKDLTLTEAIARAQINSQRLRSAEAQVQSANQALSSARAERFPTLSVSALASYVSEVPFFQLTLPVGQSISREMGSHETYQSDLRLSVPLFTGGRIPSLVSQASAATDLSSASLAQVQASVALATRQGVINLYRADQSMRSAQSALGRAEILAKDVRSLYDAGAADSVDLLEIQLALTKAGVTVDMAEIARHTSAIVLGRLIQEEYPESLVIAEQFPTPMVDDSLLVLPPDSKYELLQASASIAYADAQRRFASSDWFPTVALFGGYSYGKPNLDRFNDRWNDYFTTGATLSWSLNLGGKTASQVRRATYARNAYEHAADEIRVTLNQEARMAREQVVLAGRKYSASLASFSIAAERFRLAKLQFSEGTLSTNRLTDIQESLALADTDKAVSLADYHLALSYYYFVIGSDKLEKGF